jgi:hypothetical protein
MLTFVVPGYALAMTGAAAAGVALILAMMTVSGIQLLSGNKVDVAKEIYTDIKDNITWMGDVVSIAVDSAKPIVNMAKTQIIEITDAIKSWFGDKSISNYVYDDVGELEEIIFEMEKSEVGYKILWKDEINYSNYFEDANATGNITPRPTITKPKYIPNGNELIITIKYKSSNINHISVYFKDGAKNTGFTTGFTSTGVYRDVVLSYGDGKYYPAGTVEIYCNKKYTTDEYVIYGIELMIREKNVETLETIEGKIDVKKGNNILDGIDTETIDIVLPVNPANTYAPYMDIAEVITGDVAIPDAPEIDVEMPDIDDLKLPHLITTKFPFSIPFDIARAFNVMVAAPAVPSWVIPVKIDSAGIDESIEIDLADYEPVAKIVRWFSVTMVVLGLILATRKLIGQ